MSLILRLPVLECRTKATFKMLVIDRFAEITNHSILQRAIPRPHPGKR